MIRHCVFLRFGEGTSDEVVSGLLSEVAAMRHRMTGIVDIRTGPNVSPEIGMDKGFDVGFIIDFESADDRDHYLDDEAHRQIGARLTAATGGTDGIFVFDLEV